MSAPRRRVGAATSKKRDELLDCVERLMVREGYAAVTYRAVAAKAGVTSGLVQYYFPTLDDLFIAAIRRRSEQNLQRLTDALDARPDQPLRGPVGVQQGGVHRRPHHGVPRTRQPPQVHRVGHRRGHRTGPTPPGRRHGRAISHAAASTSRPLPDALLFLVTGIPKLIRLEQGVGLSSTHAEVIDYFESFLATLE